MPIIQNHLDLCNNELQNAHFANLGSDPTSLGTSDRGLVWQRSDAPYYVRTWDGAAYQILTNVLEGVTGIGAITAGAISGKSQAISIAASSGSVPGTMSAADFTKLGAATASNTASTIVFRDGSGNFAAGVITASLTGTASNATNLNSQAGSYYLDRANHSGTQLASTIFDFDTQVRTNRLDQMAAPTATVSMNSRLISNVLDPVSAQDAATKAYVDALSVGLDVKASVRVASTATVTVTYASTGGTSGRGQMTDMPNTLDGISLAATNRVLLKDQSTGAQKGIWVVTTLGSGANGVWDRATDYDADVDVTSGAFTFVEEGTVNAATGWVLTTVNPIIIGGASGTALTYTQFSGAGSYTAGAGMTSSGTTFNVIGTTNRITVAADAVDISTAYVGQATITTLGTITTGVWTGTAIAVANGGTGSTTAAAARTALNVIGRAVITSGTGIVPDASSVPVANCAATLGNASLTSFVVTHDRGTKDVQCVLTEVATDQEVIPNVTHTSTSTVTIAFATAPASAAYRLVIFG